MSINFKKILLAGTALVAVSAFSVQVQAAQQAPALSASNASFTAGVISVDPTPTAVTGAGANNSADIGGDSIDLASAITSGFTINASLLASNGGASTTTGNAGGVGGIGFWTNGTTPNTLIFGLASSAKTIHGGTGGANTAAASGAPGGAGGAGGLGILIDAALNNLTLNEAVLGGNGGAANGATGANAGGAGGAGADAIKSTATTTTITTTAAVTGGNGVNGGGSTGAASGGAGGVAGNGVEFTSTAGTLNVGANVTGGNGGAGGANGGGATAGAGQLGGTGILLSNTGANVNITAGTVLGGNSGAAGLAGNGALTALVGGKGLVDSSTGESITISAGAVVKGGNGAAGSDGAGAATAAGIGGLAVSLTGATAVALNNAGTVGDLVTQTNTALNLASAVTTFTNTGSIVSNSNLAANATVLVAADQGAAGFTNAGTIKNASVAATGTAVNFTASQAGTFTNSGTITANGAGTASLPTGNAVLLSANPLTFVNSGTINGNITDGATASTPIITNTGTILGDIVLVGGANAKTINLQGTGVTGVGATATIDMHGVAGANTVNQTAAASVVTGTATGALLFGSGTNSFTQTAGALNSLASSATAIAIVGAGGADTLNLGGGSIIGTIDLAAGANVINVSGGAFTTGGTIVAAGGITTNVSATGTFTVHDNVTATGTLTNAGTVNVNSGKTLTTTTLAGAGTYGIGVNQTNLGVVTNGTVVQATGAGVTLATNKVAFTVDAGSAPLTLGTHALTNVFTNNAGVYTLPVAASVTSNSVVYNFALIAGTVATNVDVSVTSNLANVASNGNNSVAGTTLLGVATAGPTAAGLANAAQDLLLPLASGQRGQIAFAQGNLASATTAAAANNVIASVEPTVDGSSAVTALDLGSQVQVIDDTRIASIRSGNALSGVAAGASANGWSLWVQGIGQHAQQDAKDLIPGYKANTWGGAVGVDSSNMVSNGVLGASFNYGRTKADSANVNTTRTDVDNYGFSLYGSYDLGAQSFLNGNLGYAYNKISADRHNVGGVGGLTANGDTHSDQYMAKLAVGHDFAQDRGLTLTPTASAAYTHLKTKGFTETGAGGLDDVVSGNSLNVLKLGVGAAATWNLKNTDGSSLKPALHVGYTYDALKDRVETTTSFAGDTTGATFASTGPRPDRHAFNGGVGVVYATTANWDLSADYDYTYKAHYDSHTGLLRATSHF